MSSRRRTDKKHANTKQKKSTRSMKRRTLRTCAQGPIVKTKIVRIFMEMLNTVKLYHWKTRSYAEHKATDELYERLNEHVDKFVEVLLGKNDKQIERLGKIDTIRTFDSAHGPRARGQSTDFKECIYEYREFLTDLDKCFDTKKDTDLLNIRDEILGDVNQFLYLMTLSGEPTVPLRPLP